MSTKNNFEGFFGFPVGTKMAKKNDFSRFCHILAGFGHFGQFKHEKNQPKPCFFKVWLYFLCLN